MGSNLHILPWPPAQTSRPPWSRSCLAQAWPLPITSIPRGPPNGFSLTASTSGLSSPVHTQQSQGSFQTTDSVSLPTASNPDSRTRVQELTWVWPWPRAPASCPVSQSTLECLSPLHMPCCFSPLSLCSAAASAREALQSFFAWLTPTHPLRPKAGITSPGKSSLILSFHPGSGPWLWAAHPLLGGPKQVTCPRSHSW